MSPNLAALDEALLLLTAGVQPQARLRPSSTEPLKDALDGLLAVLNEQYITGTVETLPISELDCLRQAGIPVMPDAAFRRAADERTEHRKLLRGFVENDDWKWMDVLLEERETDGSEA